MAIITEEAMRAAVALADSDLQFVLQEANASLQTQYKIVQVHQTRKARTAGAQDFGLDSQSVEGRAQISAVVAAWEMSKDYAAEESKRRAEAQVLGQRRTLQVHERQAMIKAVQAVYGKINEGETPSAEYLAAKAEECESNEPRASSLDQISSKRDSQVESLQSSLDPNGHLRVTRTVQKLEMPHNSEAYRRVMKVEAFAWLCMSARFKAKRWLRNLKLETYTKFVEYIMGDKVAGLRLPSATGADALQRPPWAVVLSYEFKLRTEAFKMVVDDGITMAEAFDMVAVMRLMRKDARISSAHACTCAGWQAASAITRQISMKPCKVGPDKHRSCGSRKQRRRPSASAPSCTLSRGQPESAILGHFLRISCPR